MARTSAGVDTWRLGFKVGRRPPGARFKLDGYEGFWFPNLSLVALEGHPDPNGLAAPELLAELHEGVREALEDVCGPSEPTGVLRLDSTAQVHLGGSQGLATLRGLASVAANVARIKPGVIGKPVETVNLLSRHGRGAKLARGYDPFFRGLTERGAAVRLEAQDRRLDLDYGLNALTPRERFHRRFGPIYRASQNVTVGGFPTLAAKLGDLVLDGTVTPRQAELLGGYVVLESAGLDRMLAARTVRRRRQALLEVGLALADDSMFEPVEVNLAQVFEQAMEDPAWLL